MDLTLKVYVPLKTVCESTLPSVLVSEADITDALRENCECNHSSCDSDCPVFKANGGKVPLGKPKGKFRERECICFKDGREMLGFLKDEYKKGMIS